jgi:plastocyanin
MRFSPLIHDAAKRFRSSRCSAATGGRALAWLGFALTALTAGAANFDVGVYDYFFEPLQLSIQTGDTVEWTAYGFGHTVISDTRLFDSSLFWGSSIPALRSYKFTFHHAGTFPYYSLEYGGPDGTGMAATITVTGSPTNQIPAAPLNVTPSDDATNQPIRAELGANAFADGDAGDVHTSSQWLVRRASDHQLVYDSGEVMEDGGFSAGKTNRFLPSGLLDYGATYEWQVRYRDSYGAWSACSAVTTFSTLPPALQVIRQAGTLVFAWPTNSAGFELEFSTNISSRTWTAAAMPVQVIGGQNIVSNTVTDGLRLYRLKKH